MNVGDYVRLNNCVYDVVVINRIAEIFEDTILTENDGSMYQGEYSKEEVIKCSPDIFKIIEPNDYVNGKKVISITRGGMDYISFYVGTICLTKDIKTIITHEQIERMEYKL